ncbi:unnamed protein product [Closterium sp. NIES-54]
MARYRLVLGLPESLAPLPRSPAPPCTPCIEGRQRAAPHSSSSPPTTAPFQTLHLDVCGPSPVLGPRQEHYFLFVVNDYSRYTMVFPLRRKADVPTVLEPWLLAWGGAQGMCGLRLHSDRVHYAAHLLNLWPSDAQPRVTPVSLWRGSPGLAADFHVWGSLAHVRAPGANKLSPRTCACVFLGFPLDASGWVFYDPVTYQFFDSQDVTFDECVCYYRSRPHRAPPPSRPAPSGVSHVTPQLSPPQRPVLVVSGGAGGAVAEGVGTEAAGAGGVGSGGAGVVGVEVTPVEDTAASSWRPRPASPPGFPSVLQFPPRSSLRPVVAEPGGVLAGGTRGPGGVGGGGAHSGGAGARGTGTVAPTPRIVRFLTREQLLLKLEREERERRAAGAGGSSAAEGAAATGPGGASTGGPGAAGPEGSSRAGTAEGVGAEPTAGSPAGVAPGAAGGSGATAGAAGGSGAAGGAAGGTTGAGSPAGGPGPFPAVPGVVTRPRPYFVPLLQHVLSLPLSPCPPPPPLERPQPVPSQLQPASPLPAPSPYAGPTGGLTERREPASRPALPVRTARTSGRGSRQRPPPVPGTHRMSLRPSTAPLRAPLPSPPASSLPTLADPESDSLRAASPTVPRLLATAVTDPSFESSAASALVTELVDFAAHCRLDYAASLVAESESACSPSVGGECALGTDVLEDRQEEFQCLATASPHLASVLLAPEGDPDALDIPTPRSYTEAIEGPYSSQWQAAMDAEMASWKSTGTYVDAVPPPRANIVSGMWIFRVKRPPGSPPVFKARYVARGFSQRQGVDYFQTFSPTPKMTTLRVLLHVAAHRDYELHSLDFSTAFLQGSLHEEIWLRRPPGFTGSFPLATQWSLRRPVYGLRQAPREWHDTLRTTLAALGFAPSTADPSLFLRTDTSLLPFYILVYVDDLVFATADTARLAYVKSELQKRHTCTDLGELRSYLGLQITRDRARRTITLTQSHMVQQVLQRFGFTYSSPQATPLPTRHSLSALPSDESVESSGPYAELVGCLMYLMTCTRPDLAYPLSILARYVAPGRHRPEHMAAVKRVLRYLCSTSGMGLVLGGRSPVVLTGHADASWADDQATQRSSQGYSFGLGSGSVSWRATRSSSVLGSSCEAEIYTGAMAAQELRWLTYLLTDLGEPPRSPPVLYVDNKAMLALCREQRLEHRTKHIALRYFLARELQQRGQLRLAYVASEANTADVFTKALAPCDHQRCCTQLACHQARLRTDHDACTVSADATDALKVEAEEQVTPVTFRLHLPASWKIHNAFHVQLLKPYQDPNKLYTGRQPPPPPPILVNDELEYKVESVLAHRRRRHGALEFLIRWKGYDPSEDSWVSEEDMRGQAGQRVKPGGGGRRGGRSAKDADKAKTAKDGGCGGRGRRWECWLCDDPDHLSFECPDYEDSDDDDTKGGHGRSARHRPRRESNLRMENLSTKSTSTKDADYSYDGKGRGDGEASCSLVGVMEPTVLLAPEARKGFQAMAAAARTTL